VTISSRSIVAATAVLIAPLGCGHAPAAAAPAGPAPMSRVLPLERLFVLEMSGVPAEDTVVVFPIRAARQIVLRHAAPDNTVFAELSFPAESFDTTGAQDSVFVTVHPRPGVYGMDVTTSLAPKRGALIRFKYPVHFAPPVAAITRYGSPAGLERALQVAIRLDGGNYGLLVSERPSLDNLQAPLTGSGTYLVVAPR